MKAKNLGKKIKVLRIENKLTLQELADKTNSSRSYIWEIENKGRSPSGVLLQKLAEALNTTTIFLLDDKQSEMTKTEESIVLFNLIQKLSKSDKNKITKIIPLIVGWNE